MADFNVTYTAADGLRLTWATAGGHEWRDIPVRVRVAGSATFYVWSVVDSGEEPPVWAEPDLDLFLFGAAGQSAGLTHEVESIHRDGQCVGFRAVARHARATATIELRLDGEMLAATLTIANPQSLGGRSLPLCMAELILGDLPVSSDGEFQCAHPYGGHTYGYGRIADMQPRGVDFVHGCIGQALPLAYLHSPSANGGVEFEFMMEGRPKAWLKPAGTPHRVDWSVTWLTDRLLAPGQTHAYGGRLAMRAYYGTPVEQMRAWRDGAQERYGLRVPHTPAWARRANCAGLTLVPDTTSDPDSDLLPYPRLDDPGIPKLLASFREFGYTAIFAISPNHTGINMLSPFDYLPREDIGGLDAERQFLDWAHEAGIRSYLWITTVGLDRNSAEAQTRPDMWTHRVNGANFYAWDSKAPDYIGYAPDGDPFSTAWRTWLKDQVRDVIGRGWDGIFIDGCIPRASNHGRWEWPGVGRDGLSDQVPELAQLVYDANPNAAVFLEEAALYSQVCYGLVCGRYYPKMPNFKMPEADPGMGGGPSEATAKPEPIPFEMARDYLLNRYAALLPGVVAFDCLSGSYYSEATRPWMAQTVLCGNVVTAGVPRRPEVFKPQPGANLPEPSDFEKSPEHRLRGHAEYLDLLRFVQADLDLMRDAPMSIEGVEVEGDRAVVGILRPSAQRCILGLIQFADRPAAVKIRLAPPIDIRRGEEAAAGEPHQRIWAAREVMRSMVETAAVPEGIISSEAALTVPIGAYSFRLFELRPA